MGEGRNEMGPPANQYYGQGAGSSWLYWAFTRRTRQQIVVHYLQLKTALQINKKKLAKLCRRAAQHVIYSPLNRDESLEAQDSGSER